MKYRVQIKAGDGWVTYTTVESLQKAFDVKRHIEDNRFEEVQITAEISTLLDLGIVDLDVRSEIFSLLADLKCETSIEDDIVHVVTSAGNKWDFTIPQINWRRSWIKKS